MNGEDSNAKITCGFFFLGCPFTGTENEVIYIWNYLFVKYSICSWT